MSAIEWKDDYKVGIDIIDDEHRGMIELINDFNHLLFEGGSRDSIIDLFGVVISNVEAHFAAEERIMSNLGFAEYADHKADHERLLLEIDELMSQYADGAWEGRQEELANRVGRWFFCHFTSMDVRLHRLHQETADDREAAAG